jgi:hypothetical protein
MSKKKIIINLSDIIDIDTLNDILDEKVKNGIPTDIGYEYIGVTKKGKITIMATYQVEKD